MANSGRAAAPVLALEAQLFTGLDGGAGQYDALYLLVLERDDGHGYGKIGLAGAGRADRERHEVVLYRLHVLTLAQRLALYLLTAIGYRYHVAHYLLDAVDIAFVGQRYRIANAAAVDGLAAREHAQQLVYHVYCRIHGGFLAADRQLRAVRAELYSEFLFEYYRVFIQIAEQ